MTKKKNNIGRPKKEKTKNANICITTYTKFKKQFQDGAKKNGVSGAVYLQNILTYIEKNNINIPIIK